MGQFENKILGIFFRYSGEINTAEDMAESDYYWAHTHAGAWIDSIQEDKETLYQTLVHKFKEVNWTEVKRLIHQGKTGIPIERLPSGRSKTIITY